MTGCQQMLVGSVSASAPVISPLAAGFAIDTLPGGASITFNTNGSISYVGDSGTGGPTNWAQVPGAGIGTGVYIKFTATSGTLSANGAATPTQLTSNLAFTKNVAGVTAVRVDFYSDAGGVNLLSTSPAWDIEGQ